VKFTSFEEKLPISYVTSLHFNEKITFILNDRIYYFGFIATESGDLYLSKEVTEQKESNASIYSVMSAASTYFINCDFIKSFGEEIQNVQFKKFAINDLEYFIVSVLTKTVGYYCLLTNISELNQYDLFYEELVKTNWNILYQYSNEVITRLFFSSQYDANDGTPVSIVVLTDTLKMKICKFNKNHLTLEVIDIDIRQEILNSSFIDKSFKISDVVALHHYYNVIFLSFKKRIYLYHITLCKIIAAWNFEAETIMDLYIYDKLGSKDKRQASNLYYIFFLTNRSVLYTKIETNYKASLFKDNTHNILFVEKDSQQDYKTMLKCQVCGRETNKRCSACQQIYYCGEECQSNDWESHKDICTFKDEDLDNGELAEACIFYQPELWNDKRLEIIKRYKERANVSISKGIDINYQLIEMNRIKLNRLLTIQNVTKTFKMSAGAKFTIEVLENLIKIYLSFEDYISNILLLVYGYILSKFLFFNIFRGQ
jgi:hypothetical protein